MSGIISRIEAGVLPGTVIPKPQMDGEHRVMGWGVQRGEHALIYSIFPIAAIRRGFTPKA